MLLLPRNVSQYQAKYLLTVASRGLSSLAARCVTNTNDKWLTVKWNDGSEDKFPYLYLRENCRCEDCYSTPLETRTFSVPKLIDLDVDAEKAHLNSNGEQLEVIWNDGHSSVYSIQFLTKIRYRIPREEQREGVLRKGIVVWGDEFSNEGKLPTFDFKELLNDDHELYNWLVNLATTTGIARVINVPPEPNQLQLLGKRVGYLRDTIYGEIADLRAFRDHRASNLAYTSGRLSTHTDFAVCYTPPDVAMLHCIEQTESEGGVGYWVDGFHAAHLLSKEDPELFNILAHTPVAMRHTTRPRLNAACRRNLISLDHCGKIQVVRYNDHFRDAVMPLPPEKMGLFYKAYYRLTELMDDKRTSFQYKLKPGEIIVADNGRVLHGRSAYVDSDNNIRLLQLAYLDWDSVFSKIRFLAEDQGIPSPVD